MTYSDWFSVQAIIASVFLIPSMWHVLERYTGSTTTGRIGIVMLMHGIGAAIWFGCGFAGRQMGESGGATVHYVDWYAAASANILIFTGGFLLISAKVGLVWIGEGERWTIPMQLFAVISLLWAVFWLYKAG